MNPYRIPEMARKYMDYDMIRKHTELPGFPDSIVRLLFVFLRGGRKTAEHSELYALVVSLVQVGMDTHDMIDTDSGSASESSMRARQLKVLAGDYFSGRFYHLLAQAGQLDMIRRLSEAVSEVNRLKVNLYVKMKQLRVSADDYMQARIALRSGLPRVFGDLVDERHAQAWPELLQRVSECDVLSGEMARTGCTAQFSESWGYWQLLQEGTEEEVELLTGDAEPSLVGELIDKYDLRGRLAARLRHAVDHLLSLAERIESDKLVQELRVIGESFLRPLAAPAPAFNETR
ncbi:heptaprenyl diphosphate synthase component 1 [Paenibacillus sp. IB182496]|uniref:Heptaprenyl diphosphate synthase component 1 n=1 Tax=Paenibacillus sabuli TaxID=2772509 RepID=A0A927BTD6_9BACL|nr:heptaprenyl diphosphate synthase component 1 [Paenibacillus sabuli]MBD2845169.1 heptaprenyl diphosphate synthase component 1 [Paenibacillus sabuli]